MTGRLDNEAFRARVEAARALRSITDVVERHVKLSKAGREVVGLCPFHNERTPSFRVNETKGIFYCFGCGRSGDAIRFLMEAEGMRFITALETLEGGTFAAIDPAAMSQRRAEDEAAARAKQAEAVALWEGSVPVAGTPGERYLRTRALGLPASPDVRFSRYHRWIDTESGEVGPCHPVLLFAVRNLVGEVTGVQRIYLRDDGGGKLRCRKPKLSLGNVRGGAVRLGPPAAEIVVCEGPEDGLTLAEDMPGRSVWVALGTSLMSEIMLPSVVRSVLIAGDNGDAGHAAVAKAKAGFLDRGVASVAVVFPPAEFKDWNDMRTGKRAA